MIRRLLPRLLGAAAVLSLAVLALPALSRPGEEAEKPLGKISSDLALVPRDALYFASVRPAGIAAHPAIKAVLGKPPLDKALEAMQGALGFGPEEFERVTVFARRFELSNSNIVVFRTRKPYDKATVKKLLRLDAETKVYGKAVCHNQRQWRWGPAVWMADDKTLVLGGADTLVPYLATLAKPGKTHPLADELKEADGMHAATVAILPALAFRNLEASIREQTETRKTGPIRVDPDIKGSKPAASEDEKKLGAGRPAEAFRVSFQRDKPIREPAIDEVTEKPLKLKGLEEAFDGQGRGGMGAMELVAKPMFRCRRVLLTFDLAPKATELTMKARLTFRNEAEAKDGQVMVDYGRIVARELATLPESVRKKHAEIAAALKPLQDALAAAEVKREGAVVTTAIEAKPDFAALVKAAMQAGFPFGERPRPRYKDRPPIDKPSSKK